MIILRIEGAIENIIIPSEEDAIQLNPLDFEEFPMSFGEEQLIHCIRKCFSEEKPMGDLLHRKAINYFRQYMIVGGMPQAVLKYHQNRNLSEVNTVKQRILRLYRQDSFFLQSG